MVWDDDQVSRCLFLYEHLFISELTKFYFLSVSEDVNNHTGSYLKFFIHFRCIAECTAVFETNSTDWKLNNIFAFIN